MSEETNTAATGSESWQVAPRRILVVDDEPDACEVVRQVLESEGYSATSETSAYGRKRLDGSITW